MKNLIQAAVVTLFAASTAQAQQAVQWKVSDGGNGHWYQLSVAGPTTWPQAKVSAETQGGHLATLTSDPEKRFVQAVVSSVPGFGESAVRRWGPWLGGFQDRAAPDYSEPRDGWRWVTGEQWSYEAWPTYQPDNWCAETQVQEDYLTFAGYFLQADGAWNDLPGGGCDGDPVVSYVIEWSADCNGDGIVDYGQCHDGTLPDYNGNNIPDCCERGEACVVGKYPVQWRSEDGGNGHWYQVTPVQRGICWEQFRDQAVLLGGYLATSTSAAENAHIYRYAFWHDARTVPQTYLGGFQSPDACEPGCGWTWVTDEPWAYSSWADLGCCTYDEDALELCSGIGGCGGRWRDDRACLPESIDVRAVYEWSADCNNDGIVDYGQILQGQLADLDSNGVPDICQQPTCVAADIYRDFNVNGADLGILLSQWGPNTPLTESDLNSDGVVNGADLGLLLSFWGTCP